jgi:hypothetical protein
MSDQGLEGSSCRMRVFWKEKEKVVVVVLLDSLRSSSFNVSV